MSVDLNSLYTELIFEHDKRPQNAGLRDGHQSEVHHVNPTCGDEITLRLRLSGSAPEDRIEDISYEAVGCAMSRASASMMTELLIGESREEAASTLAAFETAMSPRTQGEADLDRIGDAAALLGAAKFPGRVKCVLMAWKAYTSALAEALTSLQQEQGR